MFVPPADTKRPFSPTRSLPLFSPTRGIPIHEVTVPEDSVQTPAAPPSPERAPAVLAPPELASAGLAPAEPAPAVPASAGPRGRRRWPAVLAVVLALLLPLTAALVVLHPGWAHRQSAPTGFGDVPDSLRGQLSDEVTAVLENAPQIEHLGHDEDSAGARRVMCAVDPFGVDPPGTTTAAGVRWVYALHLCVIGEPGTPWDYATKSAGPVAVGLGGSPVVRLPQPQLDYRTQVRQMIPARYQPEAFGSFGHPELVARLRQRYIAEVASAPAAAATTP
jgi:hypothetical protein